MDARHAQQPLGIDRILVPGILAGMVGAVPMLLFATTISLLRGRGFFTPIYLITSIVGDGAIGRSLSHAAAGEQFYVTAQPLIFGSAIHLMLGAVFGAIFAAIAQRVPRQRTLAAAIAYAFGVLVLMSLVIVPLTDIALGEERRMAGFVGRAGLLVLLGQHVIFGAVLGTWPWLRPRQARLRLRAPSSFRVP